MVFGAPELASLRTAKVVAAPRAVSDRYYAAVRNTLACVIGLFAVYLAFEFATLWFREFPKGFYYSGYAHQGAAWLTAALALGMRPLQVLVHVVFPQAIRVALPPLANNLVALLKDSSLAFAIGVVELANVGNRVQAATFQPLPTLAATACIYLLLTTLLTQAAGALEDHWER